MSLQSVRTLTSPATWRKTSNLKRGGDNENLPRRRSELPRITLMPGTRYATPARNIIPMRENGRRWRCPRGKEEKRLPIGRGTRRREGRRSSVMVYSREHNSLAHRSMVGNYCKFIRASTFPPSTSGSPSPQCFYRSPSSILTRLSLCSEEVTATPHATLLRRSACRSENPLSRN